MNKEFKIGALLSYLSILINILIGIVYTPWMIKSIGKEDYGLFTLAMSVIGIFVFDFGLSQTVTRFTAKFLAQNKQDMVDKLLGISFRIYLYADIVVTAILLCVYFYIPDIYDGLNDDEIEKFKIVYIAASVFSVLSFPFIPLGGLIVAYEKFIAIKACDLSQKLLNCILMTICLLAGLGLYALVAVNALTGIVMILAKIVILEHYTPIKLRIGAWNFNLIKEIFFFTAWTTVAALAQRFIINVCPSILGMVSDSKNIAIFGVAIALEGYVFIFSNAISDFFLPKVTRLSLNNNQKDLLALMVKVGRLQMFLTGCMVGGFFCIGVHFVRVWLGDDFLPVYWCTTLMILPSIISQPQQIGYSAMIAQNKVKESAEANVIRAIVNLLLAYPFAKLWGCYGIALSIFISNLMWIIINNIIFVRILKINILQFFKGTYVEAAFPILICIIISYSFNYVIGDDGWPSLLVKCATFFIFYCTIVYFVVMNEFERNLLMEPLNVLKSHLCSRKK